ncbi:hypothetical protein LFT50_28255 (plasmid) [Mycobacterium intracellulare subsp. chimaera]|uniref:hypothetical protein n=2 Tax=Mycobacterium TaxID=1763 RepID=UPI001CF1BAD6|nr:hypothetical protein [Mycobacterium intracellulare]UCN12820.1 hypothetical protein LFT50_28255 [Mycobacterium intracellulare subsp. chimaera]
METAEQGPGVRMPAAVWLGERRIDCNDDTLDLPEPSAVWAADGSWVEITVPVEVGDGATDLYGVAFTELLTVRFPRWLIPDQPGRARAVADVGDELICKRSQELRGRFE